MNLTRNRVRSLGWAFVLTLCLALTVVLTLRVNAVKGQVRETENRIVSLQQSIRFLEVEFQTRANQQQLAALNRIEFGYVAPTASQYLEGERHLAALGVPRAPGAPKPIRMAHAVTETESLPFAALVSPVTGKRAEGAPAGGNVARDSAAPAPSANKGDDLVGSVIGQAASGPQPARVRLAGATVD